ncbi:hypothetical protein OF83DRAFT_1160840 [Amylostereum chailletii]|nr:hypothetical protein OF83DRAFT_1160840 [Amylostereum chailletii]
MSRPRPLQVLSTSGREHGDLQVLTPRTPHSRAGRAEEGFTEIELDRFEDSEYRDYTQQQQEPLLASSHSTSGFPTSTSDYRARGDDDNATPSNRQSPVLIRVLLYATRNVGLVVGSGVAVVLFFMIILAYKRPEALSKVVGDTILEGAASSQENTSTSSNDSTPSWIIPESIISYENYTHFPLDPMEYRAECHKLMGGINPPQPYWAGYKDVYHHETNEPGKYPVAEGERTQICSLSITYMLDGHVGLLADLALMAQAAGLAREFNRTFLLDDTYWNRGRWDDHFQNVRALQPGPEPGCRAPPPQELVACPRSARSRTAKYHFGHAFEEAFEDPYGHELNRQKPIFDRAKSSMAETIRPNAATATLIRSARTELAGFVADRHATLETSDPGKYLSIHVRRGDRVGSAWKYHSEHIPMNEYVNASLAAWARLFPAASSSTTTSSPVIYLASDAPASLGELREALPEDAAIFSLTQSHHAELRELASPVPYVQKEFAAVEEGDRIRQTTGMIVDFALLSGMWTWYDEIEPGAVVCAIGSNICKMAATGLGWDRAFGGVGANGDIDEDHKRWVEVDQKGAIVPAWRAFELFP